MDIFYFYVNEEKNPESEGIWTLCININNNLRITVAQLIPFLKIWQLVDSFLVIIISDMRRSFTVLLCQGASGGFTN